MSKKSKKAINLKLLTYKLRVLISLEEKTLKLANYNKPKTTLIVWKYRREKLASRWVKIRPSESCKLVN